MRYFVRFCRVYTLKSFTFWWIERDSYSFHAETDRSKNRPKSVSFQSISHLLLSIFHLFFIYFPFFSLTLYSLFISASSRARMVPHQQQLHRHPSHPRHLLLPILHIRPDRHARLHLPALLDPQPRLLWHLQHDLPRPIPFDRS